MSLLSIVASSSAFRLPASPPPKGSSIDSDWSTKNKKQPGFLRLISAWYAMVFLHFSWHHENYDSHMPAVTGWSPVATIPRMQQHPSLLRHSQGRIERHAHCLIAPTERTRRDPDHPRNGFTSRRSGIALGRQRAGLRLPNDRNRLAVYAASDAFARVRPHVSPICRCSLMIGP